MGSFKVTRSETDIVRLAVSEIRSKSPDVKTILLDNSAGRFAAYKAGQHAKLCVTVGGCERWKSFTISSSPTQAGLVALTIKRNPRGTVSRWLHEQAAVGDLLSLMGPKGRFFLDPGEHVEPVVWIAAGIGITPILSMLRCLADRDPGRPCRLLYGARQATDLFFASELQDIQGRMPNLSVAISLTRPAPGWSGQTGRILPDGAARAALPDGLAGSLPVATLRDSRFYLCCPGNLNPRLRDGLLHAGVSLERIHCEQFFKSDRPVS